MSHHSVIDLPMVLRDGTVILMNGRLGTIAQNRAKDCLIIWDEHTDPKTGEVLPRISGMHSFFELGCAVERNQLHIKFKPAQGPDGRQVLQEVYKRKRSAAELERAAWRLSYIEGAQELIAEGAMGQTRAEFVKHFDSICGRGNAKQTKQAKQVAGKTKAGFSFKIRSAPECGETVFRWFRKYNKSPASIFDKQSESGNDRSRYSEEELDFARDIINTRLNEERASISNILESVQAAFGMENRRRGSLPVPMAPLRVLGYQKVWDLIAQISPVDHAIRTKGMEVAYKDLHCLGLGLQITRALERVELDVCEVDLMVFFKTIGVWDHLTEAERLHMGLDGQPKRARLSAAVDVFTGSIMGFQGSVSDTTELALRTVEMIYLDKQPLADAVGAMSPWNMRGHPELIAFDRGNSYLGDDFYLRLATAGITNLGVPAGKPFLKPWIERWFRTVGSKFIQRFTGRTFSDVILKGENDPQARATLTIDELLAWLVRWVVDDYHNCKPRTLGKKAPRLAWEDALREAPPYAEVDEDQLRVAFGIEKHCKLSRQGFRVGNLHYWSEELIPAFLSNQWLKNRQFKVYWWSKQIGAIAVEMPDGRTVQAQCIDPKWHGKNYDDLRLYMEDAARLDGLAIEAREAAIVAMDAFSNRKAVLAGLMPHQPTAADLDYQQEKFSRHMDIPSRKLAGMTDIFGDEIIPEQGLPVPPRLPSVSQPEPKIAATTATENPTETATRTTPNVVADNEQDIME